MSEPTWRSDLPVQLVQSWGSDALIARAAWVRAPGEPDDGPEAHRRVIRAMLCRQVAHTSPFEHAGLSVYVEAPVVVWWEWTRHRFMAMGTEDHVFSLESGRYRVLDGEFYLPPPERPIREPEGFKAMRPQHVADEELTAWTRDVQRHRHQLAWHAYEVQLARGVAREVARLVLGPAIYYAGYVSANLLAWLHFLRLRTRDDPDKPSSYPQWEIEKCAQQCEALLTEAFPLTLAAFRENP